MTITRLGMSAIDSDVKEKLLAEARFLRAFYYYHALTYWGGVPLLKDEISSLDEVKYVKEVLVKNWPISLSKRPVMPLRFLIKILLSLPGQVKGLH